MALKVLEGTAKGKGVAESYVVVVGRPCKPSSLGVPAALVWERLVRHMPPSVWAEIDEYLLASYCNLVVLHEMASEEMNRPTAELSFVGERGGESVSVWVKVLLETSGKMATVGARLGLDPVARSSIKSKPDEERKNKFAGLAGGAPAGSA
jgi:phage terminase small subunit